MCEKLSRVPSESLHRRQRNFACPKNVRFIEILTFRREIRCNSSEFFQRTCFLTFNNISKVTNIDRKRSALFSNIIRHYSHFTYRIETKKYNIVQTISLQSGNVPKYWSFWGHRGSRKIIASSMSLIHQSLSHHFDFIVSYLCLKETV